MTAVDEVFRDAWPVVVAATARLAGDLDLAEDCAQEAFERALRTWSTDVPVTPRAWLVTTARRIALDRLRRDAVHRRALPLLVERGDDEDGAEDGTGVPTDPLRLLFLCCHPALSRESQVALTLRLVCGLDVPTIAAALLTGHAGVARRITRAKQKIAAAAIPFRVPSDDDLPERLDAVLTVIHLVHTAGHVAAQGPLQDDALTARAVRLARLLVRLLPDQPEPRGLLALILLTEARGPGRSGEDGEIVLLGDQDRTRWDRRLAGEGLALATAALHDERHGRFTLQAAVAGLHAVAPSWADTDWEQVVVTYDALVRRWPSPVAALNRAMARSRLAGADLNEVLTEIDGLSRQLPGYRYLPAARADVLVRLRREPEAAEAYGVALALATNPAERRHLARRRAELSSGR